VTTYLPPGRVRRSLRKVLRSLAVLPVQVAAPCMIDLEQTVTPRFESHRRGSSTGSNAIHSFDPALLSAPYVAGQMPQGGVASPLAFRRLAGCGSLLAYAFAGLERAAKQEEGCIVPNEKLTTSEAAQRLGYSSASVRKLCEGGRLDGAFKLLGGHWRVPEQAVEALIESSRPRRR
jgi:excisionase family DNA binding protein